MTSRTLANNVSELRSDYTPQARAERLIAAGRLILASCSLAAVYLEPSTPVKYQQATYSLLLIYTIYAAVMAGVAWRLAVPSRTWTLASHAADLVLFSVFISLTEGPASPFFLYFVFSLFCATLRFPWRGILATGLAAMAVYGVLAVISQDDPQFDPSRVLIRESYLAVIAALLVYLGVYQQRLRLELAGLAAWPRELAARIDDVLRATLAHAALVLDARRVVLIWEESEEPWTYAAVCGDHDFALERVAPGTYEFSGAAALRNTSFFSRRDGATTLVYDPVRSTVSERDADPIGELVRKRFDLDCAIAVSLASETLAAHLLIPIERTATADDLALAHIAGRLVLASLEQFFFVQQVRQTASAEERLRISRELHDGIVQSLGGVGLQLQAIRTQLLQGTTAAERLEQIQRVIEHDQREVRAIVRELRPHDTRDGGAILTGELQRMRERFPLEWGLTVDVRMPSPVEVPARLAHELCRIVNESLSNAARHGSATHAMVTLHAGRGEVELTVTDNGRGFPFTGTYDLEALARSGSGPRTLRERVSNLGGSLTIDSSARGASIGARIPIEVAG